MIIIGYQGIGKSTLAKKSDKYIDLESSSFWIDPYTEGTVGIGYEANCRTRWANWCQVYGNIAEHLSQQGYVVFTSSHEDLRTRLKRSSEEIYVCYPAPELKQEWLKRLEDRYKETNLPKDLKAWQNAAEVYDKNIMDLRNSGFKALEISTMDYDLDGFIKEKLNNG